MNIVCIPYHDWRKIQSEGFRTRDAHFIEHLARNSGVGKMLIVNRPISLVEYWVKKKARAIEGSVILKGPGFKLYQISDKIFVLDTMFRQFLRPALRKKNWFFKYYGHTRVTNAVAESLKAMDVQPDVLLSQNIFAVELFQSLQIPVKIFDAWDNFSLFPEHAGIKKTMQKAYGDYVTSATHWTTNSEKNVEYYLKNYSQEKCLLIRNGVDIEKFGKRYPLPVDLQSIKHPIVGFGGKITHLFDYELFNHATAANLDKSFVIVGQILDYTVFNKIIRRENVYYLGDKTYSTYPSYITNFDMGIIPYVTNDLEHGADSIKTYEYLAASLEVVGTPGAGMTSLSELIKIGKTKEQFSQLIRDGKFKKDEKLELPGSHLWSSKVNQLITLINILQQHEN